MLDTSALPKGLDALVGMAHLAAQVGQQTYSLKLLSLVQHHPASRYEIKLKAQRLWVELTAKLPSKQVAEAEASGRTMELRNTAITLLSSTEW